METSLGDLELLHTHQMVFLKIQLLEISPIGVKENYFLPKAGQGYRAGPAINQLGLIMSRKRARHQKITVSYMLWIPSIDPFMTLGMIINNAIAVYQHLYLQC